MQIKTSLSLFALAMVTATSAWAQHEPDTTLQFGIVPQQSALKLAQNWIPMLHYLSEKTGYTLRFRTAPNIPEFEKRVGEARYDIAYMNPYHYTVFGQTPGYRAFAKQQDKRIKGLMVVRKDSPITALQELSGKALAFPAPAAFAASVLPRSQLAQQGIRFDAHYVSSHDSVYRSVAKGLFTAGGGIQRTLGNVDPQIRAQLKVLWTTEGYTPHAFAARPGLDSVMVQKLQQAMLNMAQDSAAQPLLKALNFKGLVVAHHEDWDDVRQLHVEERLGRLIGQ
ncbi:phosphate/phosphite/phosphonate ABC transporter substrate-binding protein [Magnetococcus marinus]|nr:phosphate/phosphite/phosphonate ABC transporter substrate-binding protein [Magnetococcus marinus]